MDNFLLSPVKVLRRSFGAMLVPSIPILFLVAYVLFSGVSSPMQLMAETDYYLGGNMYLAASNLTAYNDLSTNIQIPLIRLGGIAERANLGALFGSVPSNQSINQTLVNKVTNETMVVARAPIANKGGMPELIMAFVVLFFGFLSYAMVARVVHSLKSDKHDMFGIAAINGGTIVLSAVGAFLMLFFSSFYLGGLKLLVVVGFGIYFTFSIPYAALGMPLGESLFRGFKFTSAGMSKIVASYIGCMGAAVMIPIGLLLFTTPLIVNLPPEQTGLAVLLKVFLGLFSVVAALFYQMALCAEALFGDEKSLKAVEAVQEKHVEEAKEVQ